MMASTSLRLEQERVLVTAEGELDMAAAGGLRGCLVEACEQGLPVVLDLAAVTFVDSSASGCWRRRTGTSGTTAAT